MKIDTLEKGKLVELNLVNQGLEIRETKSGKEYVKGNFSDSSGDIVGNMWYVPRNYEQVKDSPLVSVKAVVDEFNGLQLNIKGIRCLKAENLSSDELRALLYIEPGYKEDKTKAEINALINSINDSKFKQLTINLFDKWFYKHPQEPAARSHHHNGLYGMLVHILQTASIAKSILESVKDTLSDDIYYNKVYDLVIAGSLLHDIGKFLEYHRNKLGFYVDYSLEGNLLGHLVLGQDIIVKEMQALDFSKEDILMMRHIIASHHQKLEYGAIKTPATLAATIISIADDASAKTQPMAVFIKQSQDGETNTAKSPVNSFQFNDRGFGEEEEINNLEDIDSNDVFF